MLVMHVKYIVYYICIYKYVYIYIMYSMYIIHMMCMMHMINYIECTMCLFLSPCCQADVSRLLGSTLPTLLSRAYYCTPGAMQLATHLHTPGLQHSLTPQPS